MNPFYGYSKGRFMAGYSEYIPSLYRTRVILGMNLGRTGVNGLKPLLISIRLLVNDYYLTCHSDEGGI